MAVIGRWFGVDFEIGPVNSASDPDAIRREISFDAPFFAPGNRLARVIWQFQVVTELFENSLTLAEQPESGFAYASYTPNPQAPTEPSNPDGGVNGEYLFRQDFEWVLWPWTDGVTFSSRWSASSGGVQTSKAERTLVDPSESRIHFGLIPNNHFVGDGVAFEGNWIGWMTFRYLVYING